MIGTVGRLCVSVTFVHTSLRETDQPFRKCSSFEIGQIIRVHI